MWPSRHCASVSVCLYFTYMWWFPINKMAHWVASALPSGYCAKALYSIKKGFDLVNRMILVPERQVSPHHSEIHVLSTGIGTGLFFSLSQPFFRTVDDRSVCVRVCVRCVLCVCERRECRSRAIELSNERRLCLLLGPPFTSNRY